MAPDGGPQGPGPGPHPPGGLPRSVALVGLGLMGGSLARALASLPSPPLLLASSRSRPDLDAALEAGVVDRVDESAEGIVGEAELVVYATPMGVTLDLLGRHRSLWADAAVVTDLASLKAPVLERARTVGVLDRFVGSHPMAGGTASGFRASRSDLFEDATVWLTGEAAPGRAREAVEALWSSVGATSRWTDPARHDRLMAWTSHLPQLASTGLALVLEEAGLSRADLGPGGKGMVRLGASGPEMWADLLAANAPADAAALRRLADELAGLAGRLEGGDVASLASLMSRTRSWVAGPEAS